MNKKYKNTNFRNKRNPNMILNDNYIIFLSIKIIVNHKIPYSEINTIFNEVGFDSKLHFYILNFSYSDFSIIQFKKDDYKND